jgi:hypothetical protein
MDKRAFQIVAPDEIFEFPSDLRVNGVGRDAGNERFVSVCFTRSLNDQELRALHDVLRTCFNG